MFSQKYAIDISDIRLIPFRCNKGELPTLAQRKRFDGFILTSAISPAIDYFLNSTTKMQEIVQSKMRMQKFIIMIKFNGSNLCVLCCVI